MSVSPFIFVRLSLYFLLHERLFPSLPLPVSLFHCFSVCMSVLALRCVGVSLDVYVYLSVSVSLRITEKQHSAVGG